MSAADNSQNTNERKPLLNLYQIVNMNVGFFGLQYSFGLQQANMTPIYSYLGADESKLPYLWLASPITGLIVQPIIGAMSDKTISPWGRRTPYIFMGALVCTFALFFMPFSSALWMAASTLWILDAANNATLEPYRAFVSDKLQERQHSVGFLVQSAFTGLGQTLAYLTPTLLILIGFSKTATGVNNIPLTTFAAFIVGGIFSIATVLWSMSTTKENKLSEEEIAEIKSRDTGIGAIFGDIWAAIKNMPIGMRQMAPMMLLSWYGMFTYWIYISRALAKSIYGTTDPLDPGFRNAELLVGQIGAFYNFIAFLSAFALIPVARRLGAKVSHAICLFAAGLGLIAIPQISNPAWLFIPMLGIGFCWASMMGNTYVILARFLPANKTGIYMGIFNLFIVVPMLIQTATLPQLYHPLLGGSAPNAILLAGVLLIGAAGSVFLIREHSNVLAAASGEVSAE